MNPSVGGSALQQQVGGLAALYLATASVVAMPNFLVSGTGELRPPS